MRRAVKADGSKCYEYDVLVYTDDIMEIAMDPRRILMEIDQHCYLLKPDSIGEPKTYLGATITKFYFSDEPTKVRWVMCSGKYVNKKDAIRNVLEEEMVVVGAIVQIEVEEGTECATNWIQAGRVGCIEGTNPRPG